MSPRSAHLQAVSAASQIYVQQAMLGSSTDYVHACETLIKQQVGCAYALLMSSCTHALEAAMLLLDIGSGDEVITASFQFTSVGNAVALRGARPIFVDCDATTLCLDVAAVEHAITPRTKAVVAMHYAGIGHNLEQLVALCATRGIVLIEDAAHAIGASYMGRPLGSFGDMATLSFHHTKNVSCGEGGALLLNGDAYFGRANTVRDKGTNRRAFIEGRADRYRWTNLGSSYSLSSYAAAMLLGGLEEVKEVTARRRRIWARYSAGFDSLRQNTSWRWVTPGPHAEHNGHIFALLAPSNAVRDAVLETLTSMGVSASFHYQPLHTSPAGTQWGTFVGEDVVTTASAKTLLRLPIVHAMSDQRVDEIIEFTHAAIRSTSA